jgi:hypothetical protein
MHGSHEHAIAQRGETEVERGEEVRIGHGGIRVQTIVRMILVTAARGKGDSTNWAPEQWRYGVYHPLYKTGRPFILRNL